MSTARFQHGVGVLDKKLWAVGGVDDNYIHLASVEVYDPNSALARRFWNSSSRIYSLDYYK